MTTEQAIEVLYRLNTGVIGTGSARHERPHKPVLLLAVLDLLALGLARPDHVPWSNALRDRFRRYFDPVKSHNDECSPDLPFYHLQSDGFWHPIAMSPQGEIPLPDPPLARDLDSNRVFGRFTPPWHVLLAHPATRTILRDALCSRYFPASRQLITVLFEEPSTKLVPEPQVAEEERSEQLPGRSSAFRRQVLEVYDYQCVACGLRIRLPQHELTFVDAAHLVPFALSRNDHPTNGLALCKNHHWALDQRLIAPDPSGVWRVSRHIESRRSRGEEELFRLDGQLLLPPVEPAFAPKREHLAWRWERLLN